MADARSPLSVFQEPLETIPAGTLLRVSPGTSVETERSARR